MISARYFYIINVCIFLGIKIFEEIEVRKNGIFIGLISLAGLIPNKGSIYRTIWILFFGHLA